MEIKAVMAFTITIMLMTVMIIITTVKYLQHDGRKMAMFLSMCTCGMLYNFAPVYVPFSCALSVSIRLVQKAIIVFVVINL